LVEEFALRFLGLAAFDRLHVLLGGDGDLVRAQNPPAPGSRSALPVVQARDLQHDRIERPDGVCGIDLDLQPALSAVQVNGRLRERALFDRHRHPFLLGERADAADVVPGQPFGIGRAQHVSSLAAKRCRKLFHADFVIRRHHDADRLAVDFRHQCLQHTLRFHAKRLRGLQADPVGA
jgi:hypothetical protein